MKTEETISISKADARKFKKMSPKQKEETVDWYLDHGGKKLEKKRGHPNKGKTWKKINGNRVWIDKKEQQDAST
jgi:hypothetical protein